ncbi:MAG: hypothetical protein PHH13_01585 [Candidatus Peribacteraceae bacterium]|nr:hypothetical protein [Candidatus Peribacteraceae bacterium]
MMNVFSSFGSPLLFAGSCIHFFFGVVALTGLVLFIVWASKNLKKESLKTLSIWLIVLGILGALLTFPMTAGGLRTMFSARSLGGPGWMMNRDLDDDERASYQDFLNNLKSSGQKTDQNTTR